MKSSLLPAFLVMTAALLVDGVVSTNVSDVSAIGNLKTSNSTTNGKSLNPAVIKGYKFFDSGTGEEIVIRGIAYNPRPNTGDLNKNSVDYFTEEHRGIWERDIPYLKALGVNAVRLYAVDHTKNHDGFMCALQQAGIYTIISLARDCPTCAITRDEAPKCYPKELKEQGQAVINAFAKYPNVLGFSAGNEVNHFTPGDNPEWNGPCQKKFLRDMRKYIASCPNMRKVPVGVISADSERDDVTLYYNCASKSALGKIDPYENAEWFGLNSYLYCAGNVTQLKDAGGYELLLKSFESYNYSIPAILSEFGCLSKSFPTVNGYEGQRNFNQAKWLLEEKEMRDQFAGGFAFEYSIEAQIAQVPFPFQQLGGQNYGIGHFSPEDCDDVKVPCRYNPDPAFLNLESVYQRVANGSSSKALSTTTTMNDFKVPKDREGRTACPAKFAALRSFQWTADSTSDLKCPSKGPDSTFQCPVNLDDLRHVGSTSVSSGGQSRWIGCLLSVISLAIASIILAVVMRIVAKARKSRDIGILEEIRRITVADSKASSGDGDSDSQESTGLLSMKGWNYLQSGTKYHSIGSDLSDESERA